MWNCIIAPFLFLSIYAVSEGVLPIQGTIYCMGKNRHNIWCFRQSNKKSPILFEAVLFKDFKEIIQFEALPIFLGNIISKISRFQPCVSESRVQHMAVLHGRNKNNLLFAPVSGKMQEN